MKRLKLKLKKKVKLIFFLFFLSFPIIINAQNGLRQIKGVVKDSKGNSIPGVSVLIKGTQTGTQTDLEGRFSLQVNSRSSLVFSFLGFTTKEIIVGSQTTINVQLEETNKALSEVVVIGYGQQRKADVTSAVTTVQSENFVTGPVTDAGALLKGKVAGLTISNPSGDPNAQSQILLRGTNTINGANTNVLVIIDGVPGDLLTVAPEDIAEISVLKDGSSAAIYGVRGSNGVIIVTTKHASGNNVRIDYNGSVSTSELTRVPKLLTAQDYRDQIAAGTRPAGYNFGSNTDWIKAISKKFPVSNLHSLSFSGGNSQTNYYASLNYRYLDGTFNQSFHEQTTGRIDVNHTMLDGKLKFNLGIISTNFNDRPFDYYDYHQALNQNPTAPVKMPDGTYYQEINNFEYQNPVSDQYNIDRPETSFNNRYNATVTVLPVNGLRLAATASYNKSGYLNNYFANFQSISTLRDNQGGVASTSSGQSVSRFLNVSAEYSKSIGDDNRFSILAGYEYQDNDSFNSNITNHNFPTDLFGYNLIQLGTAQKNGQDIIGTSRFQTNLISYFARGTYNYKERYLLLASLRIDGASQLYGAKEPFGKFPSIQLGWRITKEAFMQKQKFFDDLKLRAGYGVTGNQPNVGFLAVGLLGYGNYTLYNGQWIQTLSPSQNANPSLKWEEKHETNIGLDYSMLKGLITGTIDVYDRKIKGLLYNYTVPSPPNLYPTTQANVGTMENKGLEVAVNINPFRSKDFQWTSGFNFSTNSNKLISLSNDLYQATVPYFTTGYTGPPIQTFTSIVQVGRNIGDFYGFKVVGISPQGQWIYQEPDGKVVPYSQFNHSFNDKQVIGNGLPKFYAGWNNSFRYKNIDLSITMRGAFGYQILNFQRMYFENNSVQNYNRLKSSQDLIFGTTALNKNVAQELNSYYVENGDFWKIDNVNLGYTFKNLRTKYIRNPRIFASALNTFVITGYKGSDPEVDRSGLAPGIDNRDTYPSVRTFTVGLSASF